jgi:ribosomal protein S18 acetylase RimI-like enzyme
MSYDEIRELGPGDEEILQALALESNQFEIEGVERPPRPLDAADAATFLADPSAHLWVAFLDRRPVGFVLAYVQRRRHGDTAQLFVYEVGVRAESRRQGIATALITHVMRWTHAAGIEGGFLLAGESNTSARAFYDSLGWRADDERDLVYSFRVEDLIRGEP